MFALKVNCVGRRVELIEWLDEELTARGIGLFVDDADRNAPAYSVAERWKYQEYTHEMTLLDTQLVNMAMKKGCGSVVRLVSDEKAVRWTYDKSEFFLRFNGIVEVPPTLIIKNQFGSGSAGVEKVVQPFIEGQEWNIQLYFDFITGKIAGVFMQEKILMRAGETERGRTAWSEDLWNEVKKLEGLGFYGAVDIDAIISDKPYIIDINPRFGGGYQMAHHAGVNFVEMLANNIEGKANERHPTTYPFGVVFAKYDRMMEVL